VKGLLKSRLTTVAPIVFAAAILPSVEPESTYTMLAVSVGTDERHAIRRLPSLRPIATIPKSSDFMGSLSPSLKALSLENKVASEHSASSPALRTFAYIESQSTSRISLGRSEKLSDLEW